MMFEWENLFQLSEQWKILADFGLLTEYESTDHGRMKIAVGPIIEKTIDRGGNAEPVLRTPGRQPKRLREPRSPTPPG